jgi:hypothetical protein
LKEKAEHEALKAAADKKRAIDGNIYSQRSKQVYTAMKKHR